MPLLEFTFEGGAHTQQGCEFLKTLFWNLFLAPPEEADLDVMEMNFGFTLVSVAGVSVEAEKKDEKSD